MKSVNFDIDFPKGERISFAQWRVDEDIIGKAHVSSLV
jgi:hypothetical protein